MCPVHGHIPDPVTTQVPTMDPADPFTAQAIDKSLSLEEDLESLEATCILASMRSTGLRLDHLSLDMLEDKPSPLYASYPMQLALLTRLKLLATMAARISYQLGDKPELIRSMLYDPPITPDHDKLQTVLRQLLGISMRSLIEAWSAPIGTFHNPINISSDSMYPDIAADEPGIDEDAITVNYYSDD